MSRAPSSEGLRSEALRAALTSALAGKPGPLEDLLRRHGDGHGARPNLRLAAAFGAEMAALPGERVAPARSAGRERRRARHGRRVPPDRRRAWLGRTAAGRSRGRRGLGRAGDAGGRRADARPTGHAGRAGVVRRASAVAETRCWRGRSTGWRSTTARSASAPPASSSRCSPTARRWPRSPIPSRCSTICRARSPPSPARRGRRSDRMRAGGCCSRCRGRWRAWRPACAPAIAAPTWLEEECRSATHPDVRGALSNTVLILADKSSGQGAALAQGLRAALEGSAKPPRDPTRVRPGAARGKSSRPMR